MRGFNYTINLTLPNFGEVIAEVTYYLGFQGSYWEPPDSDEVTVNSIKNKDGVEIHLSDEECESYYDLFLYSVSISHSKFIEESYNQYADSVKEEFSSDLPF